MDYVLGIVDRDNFERLPGLFLVEQQVLVNPVHAVRLRGRPVVRTHRQVNLREARGHRPNRLLGPRVIGITAREDMVVRISNGGQIMLEHACDYRVFVP